MRKPLQDLAEQGVAVWLDDLSRRHLRSGDLRRSVEAGVVGITTNPTIFAKAIGNGEDYSEELRDLALRGTAVGEALRLITGADVRAACDLLEPVFRATNGRDGRVSLEVDPRLSQDAERTAAEARGLWWLVDRPNLMVKIPATRACLPAITQALADGISVNVTLIFSRTRYREVVDAFLAGLEARSDRGEPIDGIASVASFFVSRVDTEIDRRLDETAPPDAATRLHGQAALANARLAYRIYEDTLLSPRWNALEAKGAHMQRLLWASTGVKDKRFEDTRYVVELAGRDTVNTLPAATLAAVIDHGEIRGERLRSQHDAAAAVIDELDGLGIDMEAAADRLEAEGIASFARSWDELVASVGAQLEGEGATVRGDGSLVPIGGDGVADASAPAAAAPRA